VLRVQLHSMGIDHKGIVSEEEKLELYSRAKVLFSGIKNCLVLNYDHSKNSYKLNRDNS
jgi:hypothetical protein